MSQKNRCRQVELESLLRSRYDNDIYYIFIIVRIGFTIHDYEIFCQKHIAFSREINLIAQIVNRS